MDLTTIVLIFLVIYYFLRKIDLKNKVKYPEKFDGTFFAYYVPRDGEYFCKRYWFWQVEKRKFLKFVFRKEQEARQLPGGIYCRRAVKRGRGHIGEKGRIIFLREVFIKVSS
ncbi:hypothetical protein [Staphylococcus pseudoxylosus]|uniref:hypothetical protein n=1 Tax=Staphylococcus pseudoxylosus TaxID=2282419 RepID=UPI002DB55EF2|nr:hypothetical protein [Staphylococcus pseudoxylosus]MEB7754902.1 hypothetical protein [Staphylococcus pseudoxylosus]